MTTKEQVIQAARLAGLDGFYYANSLEPFERFYNLAYKAGEKAMQERAAKMCELHHADKVTGGDAIDAFNFASKTCAKAIRALEV